MNCEEYMRLVELFGSENTKLLVHIRFAYSTDACRVAARFLNPPTRDIHDVLRG